MGTVIQVASSVYNMTGDQIDKPSFLKSVVFSASVSPKKKYLGETIVKSLLSGPGISQRQFFSYGVRNNVAGLPTYSAKNSAPVDPVVVAGYIPTTFGNMIDAYITDGDFEFFAEQHVILNYPAEVGTAYVSNYTLSTNTITIQFISGTTVSFVATDYSVTARYIVAHYQVAPNPAQVYIYRLGTGNAVLDALNIPIGSAITAEFYPVIPIRLNNISINHTSNQTNGLFDESRKLFEKGTGGRSFPDIIAQVENIPELADIDYSYIVNAVSLNTKNKFCLKYIYIFLQNLIPITSGITTSIQVKTDDVRFSTFDMRIYWNTISETLHTGLGKVEAKPGDFWFVDVGSNEVQLFWQNGVDSYKRLNIVGLVHKNFIYGGKSVGITASQALADLEDSGFLFILHDPTVKSLGLVDSTEMSTANTFIVFNSYLVTKKKWYQTFLGKLFIFLLTIVAVVIAFPAFAGGIIGVLGTNLALGISLGLTGTVAIVAGAVANMLAAMVLSMALSEGAAAIFGEKWGALIGAILGFAITFGLGGGFSDISSLFSASNLLQMSSVLANGYAGFVQSEINDLSSDLFTIEQEHDARMEEIQQMINELQGNNSLSFNPMTLINTKQGNVSGSYLPESLDEFIYRTTLTGSNIVDITLSLINDYADLSLQLPSPA